MQKKQEKTGLVWFKNNLRVQDNAILNKALNENNVVLAVYYFDPKDFMNTAFGFKKTEKFRAKFLIETVVNLRANLKFANIELFVYQQSPECHLASFVKEHHVTKLYTQLEWTHEELETHKEVLDTLEHDIQVHTDYDQFLIHPHDINLETSQIPDVFTSFRKYIEKNSSIRPQAYLTKHNTNLSIENTTKVPTLKDLGFQDFSLSNHSAFPFKGGESAAKNRLNYYCFESQKLGNYKKTRNGLIGLDYSSKLSPWLANGSISARTIYWTIKKFETEYFKNQSTYWLVFELLWRDYFKYIALKYQNKIFQRNGISNNSHFFKKNSKTISLWMQGKTKSAFVNANMQELNSTGWMSNRGRQNVASFFSKELQMDWRIGAAYFESLLIDYDVHSNYGNWMYVSGVGNDPRNRAFNVELQAERYDPKGDYRRLWQTNP
ncbi:DASH family cryptochrome [Cognatitamlana onchidii]|uniref:DASH family cryptochrome n=1 Tax=Cognatitamlana onchidii TaxID=2562860 RepID=UPI0010A663D7|nr:DASH family cryptochrome [Algibacter onchidii]